MKKNNGPAAVQPLRKTHALITGLILITLFGGLAVLFPERTAHLRDVLTAIVSLVGAYISIEMVNNGVKGKFFNQALYDVENKREVKE